MTLWRWSTTPQDNDDADSIGGIKWLYKQPAAQANNSARAMMAAFREGFDFSDGSAGWQKTPIGDVSDEGVYEHWGQATTGADGKVTVQLSQSWVAPPVTANATAISNVNDATCYFVRITSLTSSNITFHAKKLESGGTYTDAASLPFYWWAMR